ncbi:MAG: endolytic transglycosylase MltG, partial [Chitinophagaceae bacterium]
MMKRILGIFLLLLLIVAGVGAWILLGSGTGFSDKKETLYLPTGTASERQVIDSLTRKNIVSNATAFSLLAGRMNYWSNIRPGKYEIKKGTSLLNIMRMLRNGQQTPVNFVITKFRTKEDLARQAGAKFEFDSAAMSAFLKENDELEAFGVTSEVAMSKVLPDTYTFLWNTTPEKVYARLAAESKKFWTPARGEQARAKGLTPLQVVIIASIVDEETNAAAERGNVASVYLNRVAVGMPLQADPTVKFA